MQRQPHLSSDKIAQTCSKFTTVQVTCCGKASSPLFCDCKSLSRPKREAFFFSLCKVDPVTSKLPSTPFCCCLFCITVAVILAAKVLLLLSRACLQQQQIQICSNKTACCKDRNFAAATVKRWRDTATLDGDDCQTCLDPVPKIKHAVVACAYSPSLASLCPRLVN